MKQEVSRDEKFDSIYRTYAEGVKRVCLHYTGFDYELAEDVTQQAFVNFYKHMDSVKAELVFPYLLRSAKNILLNYYRFMKHECQQESTIEEQKEVEYMTPFLEEDYFQKEQCKQLVELWDTILKEIKGINQGWYDVLSLLYYYDKTYDEIIEELGITKEVLYSRIYRAKQWIKKHYMELFKRILDSS